MDVRAKSLIPPRSQLDGMNERLSAIDRESRGIFPSNVSYILFSFYNGDPSRSLRLIGLLRSRIYCFYRRKMRSDDFRVETAITREARLR